MSSTPVRWQQRLENYQKAVSQLKSACEQQEYNQLEQSGFIKTFEFTFELAWKTLKDLIQFEGVDVASPRSAIRAALTTKHLSADECEILLGALNDRNLLTHTYDEAKVLEAIELIKKRYAPILIKLCNYLVQKKMSQK